MNNPRHQLILLGFICQGLSWDNYLLTLGNALLWVVCLSVPRKSLQIHPAIEGLALLGGIGAGYLLSVAMGQSTHFSIGHGITIVQAVRLMRPLNHREKIFSLLMAFFQLGVACTVILDYRFILIFCAAVWLIPKAFQELEAERFGAAPRAVKRPRMTAYATIAGAAILFFLLFPRGFIGSPIQLNRGRGNDPGTLLDNVLDPTRSGSAQSARIIFSVEGHNIGYLRCYALTEFDGVRWTAHPRSWLRPIDYVPPDKVETLPLRRVRTKNVAVFGRILPTDGKVVFARGSFFRRAFQNSQGIIECEYVWNTANNVFDYRIDPHPRPEGLAPELAAHYVEYPPQSAALKNWLEQILRGATAPTEQARRLESYLRENFTYRLGTPELNQQKPVDDFVFNQKEGHCERFASTLALLLRMKGIPSRVVIGYLPTSRNWISGWYDIRFKDAHAWTEAYFKDLGWVQLDATPSATREPTGWDFREFMEAIDVAWYSNVVNFDAATQTQLLKTSGDTLAAVGKWIGDNPEWLVALLGIPSFRYFYRRRRIGPAAAVNQRRQNQILAASYYGQLLRALAAKGIHREPHLTPWEFLAELQSQELPMIKEVELITRLFCASRYGDTPISSAQRAEIETALQSIRKFPALENRLEQA